MSQTAPVDPDPRLAELDAQLRAVRRDYQDKLSELARRASAAREASRVAEPGLYEMLLRVERERQQLEARLEAEQRERRQLEARLEAGEREAALHAVSAERDALAARVAELEGELLRSAHWAAVLEDRARVIERSLSWRLGHAILGVVKRVPGAKLAGRVLRRAR